MYLDQPEVGLLSFVLVGTSSGPLVLAHAKDEPGNVGFTQLAPSVQATLSNSSRAHGGAATNYLELAHPEFTNAEVVADTLQSEHAERFWKKRNRNVIVQTDHVAQVGGNYLLQPLSELRALLATDHAVNTDARSVLVCSPWRRLIAPDAAPFGGADEWSQRLRASFVAPATRLARALEMLHEFRVSRRRQEHPIVPFEGIDLQGPVRVVRDAHSVEKHVDFIRVTSSTREVSAWNQPIFSVDIEDQQVLLCRNAGDSVEFLLRVTLEPGFHSGAEYSVSHVVYPGAPEPNAWVAEQSLAGEKVVSVRQSDEGGRFLRAISTYTIVSIAGEAPVGLESDGFIWLTLADIQALVLTSETVTNELRSALASLLYWL
jgi:oxidase EvaA